MKLGCVGSRLPCIRTLLYLINATLPPVLHEHQAWDAQTGNWGKRGLHFCELFSTVHVLLWSVTLREDENEISDEFLNLSEYARPFQIYFIYYYSFQHLFWSFIPATAHLSRCFINLNVRIIAVCCSSLFFPHISSRNNFPFLVGVFGSFASLLFNTGQTCWIAFPKPLRMSC